MWRLNFKKYRKIFPLIIGLCVLCSALTTQAQQDNLKKYHAYDFSKKVLTKNELANFEEYELEQLRGIVFGKRGRTFKEQSIQNYLNNQKWYKPNAKFSNKMLTANESRNIDIIRETEAEKHAYIQPGDLRFWEKKQITEENLSPNTAAEWQVLIAEMEAIHGKTFSDEPWLQTYFDERYWYKRNPSYQASMMSENDRHNLAAIIAARDKQRKVALSPGDMDKFQNVLLKEEMLAGLTLNELRIMRNEFWARRGKAFVTPGFRGFYEWQDWYKPLKNQKLVKLNETEKANVALIENYENKIREKITTEVLPPETFEGLFTEDLRSMRNEIYARHGRVFKDVKLQKAFAEMTWYKPDPNFKDDMLSEVESKNLVSIKKAEEAAVSKLTEVEG